EKRLRACIGQRQRSRTVEDAPYQRQRAPARLPDGVAGEPGHRVGAFDFTRLRGRFETGGMGEAAGGKRGVRELQYCPHLSVTSTAIAPKPPSAAGARTANTSAPAAAVPPARSGGAPRPRVPRSSPDPPPAWAAHRSASCLVSPAPGTRAPRADACAARAAPRSPPLARAGKGRPG